MDPSGSISSEWLTQHIRDNIPLAENMQFAVVGLTENTIEVAAPLEPNINIHGTGFAGSLYSISVLTAWALTSAMVRELGFEADVVVRKAEIAYRLPVTSTIRCVCSCLDSDKVLFAESLSNKHKARLSLTVDIGQKNEATLVAEMVAILK